MAANSSFIKEIKQIYRSIKPRIGSRLGEFRLLWKSGSNKDLFAELAFCIFTPQSRAKACFAAVDQFVKSGLLWSGSFSELSRRLNCVRFRNNKAGYLIAARAQFPGGRGLRQKTEGFSSSAEARLWFSKNIKGLGLKEASHFLRNIGRGEDLAILDRHILKNLKRAGVIREIPGTLTVSRYLEIERKMKRFAKKSGIPLSHLDLLLWFKETGEIFK